MSTQDASELDELLVPLDRAVDQLSRLGREHRRRCIPLVSFLLGLHDQLGALQRGADPTPAVPSTKDPTLLSLSPTKQAVLVALRDAMPHHLSPAKVHRALPEGIRKTPQRIGQILGKELSAPDVALVSVALKRGTSRPIYKLSTLGTAWLDHNVHQGQPLTATAVRALFDRSGRSWKHRMVPPTTAVQPSAIDNARVIAVYGDGRTAELTAAIARRVAHHQRLLDADEPVLVVDLDLAGCRLEHALALAMTTPPESAPGRGLAGLLKAAVDAPPPERSAVLTPLVTDDSIVDTPFPRSLPNLKLLGTGLVAPHLETQAVLHHRLLLERAIAELEPDPSAPGDARRAVSDPDGRSALCALLGALRKHYRAVILHLGSGLGPATWVGGVAWADALVLCRSPGEVPPAGSREIVGTLLARDDATLEAPRAPMAWVELSSEFPLAPGTSLGEAWMLEALTAGGVEPIQVPSRSAAGVRGRFVDDLHDIVESAEGGLKALMARIHAWLQLPDLTLAGVIKAHAERVLRTQDQAQSRGLFALMNAHNTNDRRRIREVILTRDGATPVARAGARNWIILDGAQSRANG